MGQMRALHYCAANWPGLLIAAIFVAWFLLVGELFSRHCPLVPADAVAPLYCDVFFWWRWFA